MAGITKISLTTHRLTPSNSSTPTSTIAQHDVVDGALDGEHTQIAITGNVSQQFDQSTGATIGTYDLTFTNVDGDLLDAFAHLVFPFLGLNGYGGIESGTIIAKIGGKSGTATVSVTGPPHRPTTIQFEGTFDHAPFLLVYDFKNEPLFTGTVSGKDFTLSFHSANVPTEGPWTSLPAGQQPSALHVTGSFGGSAELLAVILTSWGAVNGIAFGS